MNACSAGAPGWPARLALRFRKKNAKTVVEENTHSGPLLVQRPFYPEGPGVCHVYVLHPPGGVVGGDELQLELSCEAGAHAVITTPAAAKFYRSNGRRALQINNLEIGSGAVVEWLPQEAILFTGAHVSSTTRVRLQPDAGFIGWEMVCLGRPACDDFFDRGEGLMAFELWSGDRPLWLERTRLNKTALAAASGMREYPIIGTMVCYPGSQEALSLVRSVDAAGCGGFGATLIDNVLVCRGLALQAAVLRRTFGSVWGALRPELFNLPACPPRIWAT